MQACLVQSVLLDMEMKKALQGHLIPAPYVTNLHVLLIHGVYLSDQVCISFPLFQKPFVT